MSMCLKCREILEEEELKDKEKPYPEVVVVICTHEKPVESSGENA